MTDAQVARGVVSGADVHYGGFWRRFIAFIVDWFLVSSAVAIVFLLLAAVFPAIGNSIVLRTPLDIGVTERTIESKTVDGRDGNVATRTTEKIVEETVLGKWTYFFRVIEVQRESSSGSATWHTSRTTRTRIDPDTREEIKGTNLENIIMLAMLIYWAAMESSRYQASLGKMIFGMQVVGPRRQAPHAADRHRPQPAEDSLGDHPVHRLHDGRLDAPQAGAPRQDHGLLRRPAARVSRRTRTCRRIGRVGKASRSDACPRDDLVVKQQSRTSQLVGGRSRRHGAHGAFAHPTRLPDR